MNVEEIREYCLSKAFVDESLPFDDETLVIKVKGKMFALISLDEELSINLKCDPEEAISLRELYPCVIPGYHMNKKHWNTINIDGSIDDDLIKQWIDNSYELIWNSLPKKIRD
jgi:predicted DNA-binding protein (MmcQ/YjbR family)